VIEQTLVERERPATRRSTDVLARFLDEPLAEKAAAFWITRSGWPRQPQNCRELARLLSRDIARIDAMLQQQVNAIIHAPAFQKLESSWRGLKHLAEQVPEGENIKIRVLSVS
jgi:predicted component of type VI protein secretion system